MNLRIKYHVVILV